jgi:hypothetical protein
MIIITARHAAQHEINKCDSSNETRDKSKTIKIVPDSNSSLAKLMTRYNQIKELTT